MRRKYFKVQTAESLTHFNDGKSAASFCHQMAAWFPDIFETFIWSKITKLLKTQQPLNLEKNKH
jgi:hypothetical protein